MADLITITVDSSDVVKATQYTNELTAANDRLEKELKPLLAKEKEFQRAIRQVNEAMRLNVITNKQAIAQVQALGKQYGYTQQQIDRATASMTGIRKNTNRMNATIQNAGYQIGDFAVQVQSGQNVLVAFSQQGAQLAGLLPGVAGAVTGVALVIGSSLVRTLMDGTDLFKSFAEASSDAKEAVDSLIGSTSFLADTINKDLGDAVEDYGRAILEIDFNKAVDESKKMVDELEKTLVPYAEKRSQAISNYTFGLIGGGLKAGFIEVSEEAKNALDLLREVEDVDFDNVSSLEKHLELVTVLVSTLNKESGLSEKNFEGLTQYAEVLTKRIDQIKDGTVDLVNSTKELVEDNEEINDELEAQKAHLEAILKLEQARDRVAGSLEQKFSASTRKLELMRGGLGAGLAGTQVSMEQQIAEVVAAERAVMESRQGVDGLFPREVEEHMLAFEQNLRTRLEGYMQEQAAIKELSAVKTTTSEVELEQLDEQVKAYLKYQETINNALATTEQELRQKISLIGLSKEEAELTKFIYALEKEMGATRAQLNDEQKAQYDTIIELKKEEIRLTKQQQLEEERLAEAKKKVEAVASTLAGETVGALKSIVNGTKTASEAFRDMALNIIQQIMDILIWQPLIQSLTSSISGALTPASAGGSATGMFGNIVSSIFGFQKGGVFSAGNIVPFANGGIVGSPTMFGMSGGRTGLMGEAGPEAIMPLKRGPDGKLGVEGGGNVTVNQTFNFAANGDDSVKKIIAEAAPKIAKMTEAQIINSRQRGGQMRRAFG